MRGGAAYSYVQLLLSYICGCAAGDSYNYTAGFRSSYMIFAYPDHVKVLQIVLPCGIRGILILQRVAVLYVMSVTLLDSLHLSESSPSTCHGVGAGTLCS